MQEENRAETFGPHDDFLRRIHPMFYNRTKGRVSDAAFQNTTGTNRMSVNWTKLSSLEETLRGWPGFGVASICAELCWFLNQEIERNPSEENPAHCDVVGDKPLSVRRKFKDGAEYLRYPSPA